MRTSLRRFATFVILVFLAMPVNATELLMFRQQACEWCTAWDREIGPKYARTDAGKVAPLRMIDIHAERPAALAHIKPVVFTPTFVVFSDGREVGRILGYPGEDFFWGLLEKILGDMAPPAAGSGAAAPLKSAIR